MPAETATIGRLELPSGLKVSADSIQRDGKLFSLYEAKYMGVTAFNKEAAKYDVHIDEGDAPIDRLVKYSVFLRRRDKNCLHIPTNGEYVDMLLEVAAYKASDLIKSFHEALIASHVDVTRDVLEFHGRVSIGPRKGKYEARLLRFDHNGKLQPEDEILVAPEGWIAVLGAKHRLPVETSEMQARVRNIEVPGLDDSDATGYWRIGGEPEEDEQRIILRAPGWGGGGLLHTRADDGRPCSDVGALMMCSEMPPNYQVKTAPEEYARAIVLDLDD